MSINGFFLRLQNLPFVMLNKLGERIVGQRKRRKIDAEMR